MTYRQPHHREPVSAEVPGHPGWLARANGHIYWRNGVRVPEHRKEAGENRLRVNCQAHGTYHDVARLVASAFWGDQPSGAVIHRNGNTADNRPENLRWVPQAGSNSNASGRRRLSRAQCRQLHDLLSRGIAKTQIAVAMDISPRCVRHHNTSCQCSFTDKSVRLL